MAEGGRAAYVWAPYDEGQRCSIHNSVSPTHRQSMYLHPGRISMELNFPDYMLPTNRHNDLTTGDLCPPVHGCCLHTHDSHIGYLARQPNVTASPRHVCCCAPREEDRIRENFHGCARREHFDTLQGSMRQDTASSSARINHQIVSQSTHGQSHGCYVPASNSNSSLPYGIMVQDTGADDTSLGMAQYAEAIEKEMAKAQRNLFDEHWSRLADAALEQDTATKYNAAPTDNEGINEDSADDVWPSNAEGAVAAMREVVATQSREINQLKAHNDFTMVLLDMWQRRCASTEREAQKLRQRLRVLENQHMREDAYS